MGPDLRGHTYPGRRTMFASLTACSALAQEPHAPTRTHNNGSTLGDPTPLTEDLIHPA